MAETTTTVRQAPYLEEYQEKLLDLVGARGETPIDLPDYQVAGLDALTEEAIAKGQAGIGSFEPYLTTAGDALTKGQGILEGASGIVTDYFDESGATARGTTGMYAPTEEALQGFMNPYQQQVTQQALAELTRQGDLAANKLRARQATSGALGGDRGALQMGELSRNLFDIGSRRTFEDYAKNYSQALNASQTAFENQQKRQQGVASLLAGLGQATSQEATRLAAGLGALGTQQANLGALGQTLGAQDVQLLTQLGGLQQAQSQAELDAARRNELQQTMEPYTRLGFMSDVFKPQIGSATSTSAISPDAPPPSAMSQAIGLGITGLGINKALDNPFGSIFKSGAGT